MNEHKQDKMTEKKCPPEKDALFDVLFASATGRESRKLQLKDRCTGALSPDYFRFVLAQDDDDINERLQHAQNTIQGNLKLQIEAMRELEQMGAFNEYHACKVLANLLLCTVPDASDEDEALASLLSPNNNQSIGDLWSACEKKLGISCTKKTESELDERALRPMLLFIIANLLKGNRVYPKKIDELKQKLKINTDQELIEALKQKMGIEVTLQQDSDFDSGQK